MLFLCYLTRVCHKKIPTLLFYLYGVNVLKQLYLRLKYLTNKLNKVARVVFFINMHRRPQSPRFVWSVDETRRDLKTVELWEQE